jgi:NADH:ubiquinone oxidoreductase subunit 6 (subunit J)
MLVFFFVFAVVGAILIPFAYIVGILDKLSTMNQQETLKEKLRNNIIFIPFGLIILTLDYFADLYYFWRNNFRSKDELQETIIPKEESRVKHKSIR